MHDKFIATKALYALWILGDWEEIMDEFGALKQILVAGDQLYQSALRAIGTDWESRAIQNHADVLDKAHFELDKMGIDSALRKQLYLALAAEFQEEE